MKSVTVSAPGKLMLLGEHAVVYGHPCLVTAVGQRMFCKAELVDGKNILIINAADVGVAKYEKLLSELGNGEIPKGAKFVEIAVKYFLASQGETLRAQGLKITTRSEFSSQFGFGSSSASTVCIIKALSELFGIKLSNKEIFDLAYKTVLNIQGKGSGFDVASAIYGGTLYFVTGGKTISPLAISHPLRREASLPLVVGYSGIKADTATLIKKVSDKREENKEWVDEIFGRIAELVEEGKKTLLANDLVLFGDIMNKNQELLSELGVSIEKLDNMINAVLNAGAYGAKLSGAGGGDCMIAVSPSEKMEAVKNAITDVGGQVIDVQTNVEGVRIEKS